MQSQACCEHVTHAESRGIKAGFRISDLVHLMLLRIKSDIFSKHVSQRG